ncbi:5'-nucleotidase C-terminal domain-containing protein [bacterium]|nr:5'-nucleotidase C-terminal domain-containing protein [bacterium]
MQRSISRFLAAWLIAFAGLVASCASPQQEMKSTHNLAVDPAAQPEDEDLALMLEPYAEEVAVLKAPIGRSAVAMPQPEAEAPLASWMADVSREQASEAFGRPIDAVFLNCGGIRAGIPKGDVSLFTFMQAMPFENEIVVFELSADQTERLAKKLASAWGYFPISGMTIEADAEGKLLQVLVGGEPLDPERTYTVGTSNYIAGGGDGMKMLQDFGEIVATGVLVREALIEHARRKAAAGEPISPPEDPYRYRYGGKTMEEMHK